MFTVAVGNAFDGIELQGLFDTAEEANTAADLEFKDQEWHVIEIQPIGRVS
jgi:hypothetical protein